MDGKEPISSADPLIKKLGFLVNFIYSQSVQNTGTWSLKWQKLSAYLTLPVRISLKGLKFRILNLLHGTWRLQNSLSKYRFQVLPSKNNNKAFASKNEIYILLLHEYFTTLSSWKFPRPHGLSNPESFSWRPWRYSPSLVYKTINIKMFASYDSWF